MSTKQEAHAKLREVAVHDSIEAGNAVDERAFWVLVKGVVHAPNVHLDEDGVSVVDAGVYRFE